MPTPGEYKIVQARILAYAEVIGWTIVSREGAEQRGGVEPPSPFRLRRSGPDDPRAKGVSLFFDDLLDAKVREFNPRYAEAEGALLGQFHHLHTDIYDNLEFVEHLRNRGKFFDHEEERESERTQDLFRSLHHELMTAKTRVDGLTIPATGCNS